MNERTLPGRKSGNDTPTPKQRRLERRITGFGVVIGGIVLLATLLYLMRETLNPLVIAVASAILLWPFRHNQAARSILLVGAFLVLIWLFSRLAGVLVPFVLAYILAYMLNPVLDRAEIRLKMPRWLGAILMTLVATGAVTAFFILLVPALVSELERLGTDIFYAMSSLRDYLVDSAILERLERAGVVDRAVLLDNLTNLVQDQATAIANSIPDTAQRVVRSISSLIQFITVGAITPVLFYYTLKDYDGITSRLVELFPRVNGSRNYLNVAGHVVGRYLRGQLTISAIAAVIVTTALTIGGVPFALVIGLLAGILNMIPNIGIVITQIIGILIAFVFGDPGLVKALIVFLVLLGESLLEQSVLTPKIQGQQVGLHPVLIMLSLFVFGSLMGFFGLLIAVPATALIVTAYAHWRDELTLDIGRKSSPGALDRLLNWRQRGSNRASGRSAEGTESASTGDIATEASSGSPLAGHRPGSQRARALGAEPGTPDDAGNKASESDEDESMV